MKRSLLVLLFAGGAVSGAFVFAVLQTIGDTSRVGGEVLVLPMIFLLVCIGYHARDLLELAGPDLRADELQVQPGDDGETVVFVPDSEAYQTGFDAGYDAGYEEAAAALAYTKPVKKRVHKRRKRRHSPLKESS